MQFRTVYAFTFLVMLAIASGAFVISHKLEYESKRIANEQQNTISHEQIKVICKSSTDPVSCTITELSKENKNKSFAEKYSAENEAADWNFGSLLTSIFSLGVSALGLYWVRETLSATRGTVEAAHAANELSLKAVQTAERAWVACKIFINDENDRIDEEFGIDLFIRNSNTGKTPALNVRTSVACSSMENIQATILYLKDERKNDINDDGILISPGSYYDRPWNFSTRYPPIVPKPTPISDIFLVGLVTYQTVFGSELHSTVFVYSVMPGELSFANPKDSDLRAQHGNVYLWPWAGSSAD